MIGSVITWFSVPVSYLVEGLGREDHASSVEVRAPVRAENSHNHHRPAVDEPSGINNNNKEAHNRTTLSHLSADDSDGTASVPAKPTMNRSRPSSRRQSNVGGTISPAPDSS